MWYGKVVVQGKRDFGVLSPLTSSQRPSASHRKARVTETLILEKLGPIGRLEIKPRRLTVIIGEQASGKSLVAQMLYFFRGLESHLARIFSPDLLAQKNWPDEAARRILDSLRGVPFGYFANGTARLQYRFKSDLTGSDTEWKLSINATNRRVRASKELRNQMEAWVNQWKDNPMLLEIATRPSHIFIPTERSIFTRLSDVDPSVLFSDNQPYPFRQFAGLLYNAQVHPWIKSKFDDDPRLPADLRDRRRIRRLIEECQISALAGEAYVPTGGPPRWKWRLDESGGGKILPIAATASGQMEAWPFFAIAAKFGTDGKARYFYFEEPETHLHPAAQVKVMKVIAFLVNLGHSFVVTTHSPYILYVLNNMIQRFLSLKGVIPEGEHRWLDPETVAAYRLRQRSEDGFQDVMDRDDTNLIDAEELESVADKLGGEFDALLDEME
jgi:hypothetical protein